MSPALRLSVYFCAYFLYAGALVPYFALYLAARGYGAGEIAMVLAMPQLARVAAPAFWGWLADRSGAARGIVVFSAAVLLAGYVLVHRAESYAAVMAIMLVMSLLSAGALPIVEALTLGSLEGRMERYGPIRLWGSVGFVAGVLATGAWLDAHAPHALLHVVLPLAALTLVASLLLPARRVALAAGPADARLLAVLLRPEVLAFFAACFCMNVAHGALYAFYSIYLEGEGYSKTAIGVLWTLGVLAEIVLFLLLPRVLRRFSLRAVLAASCVCAALRFALIGWGVHSVVLLAAAQLLHAATFGAYHASSVAMVHKLFTGTLQARGQTLHSSVSYGLGGVTGTLLAGWSWSALGPELSFTLSAIAGLAGAALVIWRVRV
jgi:MFS transporter, PPP family, 3-phenylpropionic acid transporter